MTRGVHLSFTSRSRGTPRLRLGSRVHNTIVGAENQYNGSMTGTATPAPQKNLSFAQLCYEHTYAGCGCGMCHEGDVCPLPVLKLEDVHKDTDAVSERGENVLKVDVSPSR